MVRATLRIVGRVQGVSYRASAQRQAEALGLSGWVANRPDGSVEAVAEGPRERVEAFVAWCRQGPPGARVDDVAVSWEPARGEFARFEIRR